jgi:hypothetical protein
MALSCEDKTTHGKGAKKPTVKKLAWQKGRPTHVNDTSHGKKLIKRTAKKCRTAKAPGFAVT